jgi:hypothetical protein
MKTAIAAAMLAVLVAAAAAASPAKPASSARPVVPLASDLQRDSQHAARAGGPLVLFFSLPDCRYCHTVRHNYLAPMLHGAHIIREIGVDGGLAATGLDGAPTTHAALARRFGVRFAPTVLFVGPGGTELAPPLKGGDTAGMYGALLEARLATARQAAAVSAPATSARAPSVPSTSTSATVVPATSAAATSAPERKAP